MDDTDLDLLLAASRPEVDHDDGCGHCRAAVARRSGRSWPRRLALTGAAGVTVAAVGAGAAATVGLPFVDHTAPRQHTQTVSTGDQCQSTFTIHPGGSDAPEVVEAKAFLAGLDIDALDISDELADLKAEYADVEWSGPGPRPDYVYAFDSQDSLEWQALGDAVSQAVIDHLAEVGLPVGDVFVEAEGLCDDHELVHRR